MMDEYKKKLIERLAEPSLISKLMREENDRKERLIRESLNPWRIWLMDRLKWRWVRRLVLRPYHIEERIHNERWHMSIYKGKRLLNVSIMPIASSEIRFVRHSYEGGQQE